MKAICGFLRLDGAPAQERQLAALRASLVFNDTVFGGDSPLSGQQDACDGAAALGATQWSRQPRGDEALLARHHASGCIVVADARIEQRAALAASLGVDDNAASAGAADLILHAWLRWGEDCVAHVDGDFVFAAWDPRRQQLFCARDRMGVRPLYLHHAPGRLFAFASRARALLALPGVPADLDEGRIADALTPQLECIDKTSTFHRAIQRLPPAHAISIRAQGLRQRRYWQLQPGLAAPLPRGDAQWADALTEVLEQAVREHLDGEQPVGCMLSGGMDSSSLAVIARDQLAAAGRGPLPTFSSIDDDPACRETGAIRAVLAQPGFDATLVDPAAIDTLRDELNAAAWHSEEPFDGAMLLLHAQYLMAARSGVAAVMDGIDADTLLSAGDTLVRQLRSLHWLAAWRNARGQQRIYPGLRAGKTLARAARSAVTPNGLRKRLAAPRLQRDSDALVRDTLLAPEFAARIDLPARLRRFAQWRSLDTPRDSASQAAQSLAHTNTTAGFERYHRVAAWHGVEPRHPFDDRRVLELCVNLPDAQRMAGGWSKVVLRRAMQGRLPDPVCWRTGKEHLGWSLVQRLVLRDIGDVRERIASCRDVLAPYVAPAKLDAALARLHEPQGDHQDVFAALHLGHWLQRQSGGAIAGVPADH